MTRLDWALAAISCFTTIGWAVMLQRLRDLRKAYDETDDALGLAKGVLEDADGRISALEKANRDLGDELGESRRAVEAGEAERADLAARLGARVPPSLAEAAGRIFMLEKTNRAMSVVNRNLALQLEGRAATPAADDAPQPPQKPARYRRGIIRGGQLVFVDADENFVPLEGGEGGTK